MMSDQQLDQVIAFCRRWAFVLICAGVQLTLAGAILTWIVLR